MSKCCATCNSTLHTTGEHKQADLESQQKIWEHDPMVKKIWDRNQGIPLKGNYFKYSENGAKRMIADAILFGMDRGKKFKKCIRCKKGTKELRREMCISCYRLTTGFSGGDPEIFKLKEESKKIKQRMKIMDAKIKELLKERK